MIQAWLSVLPEMIIGVALTTLTGMPIAWALRMRGFTFVAASVAASFALIAVASVLTPFLGIAWGVWPVLGLSVVLAAVLRLWRHFWKDEIVTIRADLWKNTGFALVAVVIAATLISLEIVRAIGNPANISQTFDAVFHLNATAQILDTANASPFYLDLTTGDNTKVFYPSLWHASVALLAGLTSVSIPVASNIIAIIVAAWVWPVGIVFLYKKLFTTRPIHLLYVGVLAAVFSAFPYLLLTWGVLYPNLLSTALIPFALAFAYLGLSAPQHEDGTTRTAFWIAFIGATGAAALAHPNALFGIAVLTLPLLVVTAVKVAKSDSSVKSKTLRLGGISLTVLAYVPMWLILTTGERRSYDMSAFRALENAISNAPLLDSRAWFITVLVASGVLVLLVAKKNRWIIVSYLLVVALFTLALGFAGEFRDFLLGPWYSDAARIASLLPIAAIILAGVAVSVLHDLLQAGLRTLNNQPEGAPNKKHLSLIATVVLAALLLTGARSSSINMQSGWMADLHRPGEEAHLLSDDELILLERIAQEVPEEAVIAGDPWTGTALAYAISEREVLFPHLQGNFSAASLELAANFKGLGVEACTLLNELEIDYMLDFEGERYNAGRNKLAQRFDGIRHIADSPVLTEIDREGEAVLYQVVCD